MATYENTQMVDRADGDVLVIMRADIDPNYGFNHRTKEVVETSCLSTTLKEIAEEVSQFDGAVEVYVVNTNCPTNSTEITEDVVDYLMHTNSHWAHEAAHGSVPSDCPAIVEHNDTFTDQVADIERRAA